MIPAGLSVRGFRANRIWYFDLYGRNIRKYSFFSLFTGFCGVLFFATIAGWWIGTGNGLVYPLSLLMQWEQVRIYLFYTIMHSVVSSIK